MTGFENVWNDRPGQWLRCRSCGEIVEGLQGVRGHVCPPGPPVAGDTDTLRRLLGVAQADAARLRAVLRQVEWHGFTNRVGVWGSEEPIRWPQCPCCRHIQTEGHAPSCALAAALKETP